MNINNIVVQQINENQYKVIESPEKIEYDIEIESKYFNNLKIYWELKGYTVKLIENGESN